MTDGAQITGVVDWDEFGLGSRALDLVALAVDCERADDHAAADRLLARVAWVAGHDGLRCLISYRAIGGLAAFTHERQAYGSSLGDAECAAVSAVLDRLEATPDQQPAGPRTPRGACGMTGADQAGPFRRITM